MRRGAGAALVVLLAGAAIAVFATAVTPRGGERELASGPGEVASAAPGVTLAASPIFVHVLGQVARPGLYELREGDRVVDAIAAAGGLTEAADPAGVNLARTLNDGEQLAVPAVGEAPAASAPGVAADGRVDLNTADVAALDTLPRIGPAMAQRIIDWREANGPFSSVDDLLAVSGIGAKTVEALRPLVVP
ncbi:competence protein ComEA [Protaetiibacter intestinalis]|uniref:Competence protein ComEA n=2 Tax=Protaetiibacter intestinalis TaxID=2419774 RepID=A0A387BAI7_9MICO|nr:ComEA family DNA-binding protein [Protaetiibacter intestinalis]AYF99373.1 competence protein ComEA [Protaetiibacter intestinalis]